MFCDGIVWWDGAGVVQEEGDICIHTADSLCYKAETKATL